MKTRFGIAIVVAAVLCAAVPLGGCGTKMAKEEVKKHQASDPGSGPLGPKAGAPTKGDAK